MSISFFVDQDGFHMSEGDHQYEEELVPPFMRSEEEASEPSVIDLMDSDYQPQEEERGPEIQNPNSILPRTRRYRQRRSHSIGLPPTNVQRETRIEIPMPSSRRAQRRTRSWGNAFSSSGIQSEPWSEGNDLFPVVGKKSGDADRSKLLPPGVADMISEMSKTMKHIQVLIQRRNAERASNAVTENTDSTVCECTVCRETLYASSSCATLCGHVFHAACIHQLAQYHKNNTAPCPVCRTTVHIGELLVLRNGFPEAPAGKKPDSIDLTAETRAEVKSELDHELSRTLRAFESLYAKKSVFDRCVAVISRNAQRDAQKMKHDIEKSKSKYREQTRLIDEEHNRIRNTISRLSEREERLEASQKKYNQDMMDIAKQRSDLKVLEEKLKAEIREAQEKTREFNNKLETVNDKQQRLDRLRQALDARKKASERKRSVSTFAEDSRDIKKKHRTQSSVVDTCHSRESPFCETLHLPSAVNRPPPPRRLGSKKSSQPTLSLSAFVPKRPGIHRPSTRVGKRNESTRF